MSKKVLISLSLLLFCALFTFRSTIVINFTKWQIDRYVSKHFSSSFHYGKIALNDNKLILQKIHLDGFIPDTKNTYSLDIDQLEMAYSLDLIEWNLETQFILKKPLLHLKKFTPDLISDKTLALMDLKNSSEVLCKEGKVVLEDKTQASLPTQHIYFHSEASESLHSNLSVFVHLNPLMVNKNAFDINLSEGSNHRKFHCQVIDADCKKVETILSYVKTDLPSDWSFDKGRLEGNLSCLFYDQAAVPIIEAEGSLKDFNLFHKSFDLRAEAQLAHLTFSAGQMLKDPPPSWLHYLLNHGKGNIHLDKGATLSQRSTENGPWKIQDLKGSIRLSENTAARLLIQGQLKQAKEITPLVLEGEAKIDKLGDGVLKLNFELLPNLESHSGFTLTLREQVNRHRHVTFNLINLTGKELLILQNILPHTNSVSEEIFMPRGLINATAELDISRSGPRQLSLHQLSIKDAEIKIPLSKTSLSIAELNGKCTLDLTTTNPLSTLEGAFKISDGELSYQPENDQAWYFSNINGPLKFRRGMLYESTLNTSLGLLQGQISCNWLNPLEMFTVQLLGDVSALSPFLPKKLEEKIDPSLSHQKIQIEAKIAKLERNFQLKGEILVTPLEQETQKISFGMDILRAPVKIWGDWLEKTKSSQKWLEAMQASLNILSPKLNKYSHEQTSQWILAQHGISGIIIKNGYFKSNDVPLETYLSPYILKNHTDKITGRADVIGSFDQNNIYVDYTFHQARFETEHLTFDLGESGLKSKLARGSHRLNLQTGMHFGNLEVQHVAFTDKIFKIPYSIKSAQIQFSDKYLLVSDILCNSYGLQAKASLKAHFPQKDEALIAIDADYIEGDVSSMQSYLRAYKDFSIYHIPTEGAISTRHGSANINFHTVNKQTRFECSLEGSFAKASHISKNKNTQIHEVSGLFAYHSNGNRLEISQIKGKLELSDKVGSDSYTFELPYLNFNHLPQYRVDFDVTLKDKDSTIALLKGRANRALNADGEDLLYFNLDPKICHIGEIQPNIKKLIIRNWEKVVAFEADPEFKLSTFVADIQRVLRPGILPINNAHIQSYISAKLYGEINSRILLEEKSGAYRFSLFGDHLVLNDHQIKDFFVTGKHEKDQWEIDQMQVDKLAVTADIKQLADGWEIVFLGLRYGKSLVMGLEGNFSDEQQLLDAKLSFFEANLEHLNEYENLKSFCQSWKPKGTFGANGKLRAQYKAKHKKWSLTVDAESSIRNLRLANAHVEVHDEVPCYFSSEEGFTGKNLKLTISQMALDFDTPPSMTIDTLNFFPKHQSWSTEGVNFAFTPQRLSDLMIFAQSIYPERHHQFASIYHMIKNARGEHSFDGRLDGFLSQNKLNLNIRLADGDYLIQGQKKALKNFAIRYNPHELQVKTQFQDKGEKYWLNGKTDATLMQSGVFVLTESPLEELAPKSKPLQIHWHRKLDDSFTISKILGKISETRFNLNAVKHKSKTNAIALEGEITTNLNTSKKFLPKILQNQINRFKIGQGYSLKGLFLLSPEDFNLLSYDGILKGDSFELYGKTLASLQAKVRYQEDDISLENIRLSDPAIHLVADELRIYRTEKNLWQIHLPTLVAKNFHPNILRLGQHRRLKTKPIEIAYAELKNLAGTLNDAESYQADGFIKFHNPKKKNFFKILFEIPKDLIARIGLDFNLLTPAMGTVRYELRGDKVYFRQFENVYSEGRRSKFYLSPEGGLSFMDLHGNLNVRLKMKQFNLIFKIAELFTISIGGTVDHPTYTLKKQIATVPRDKTNIKADHKAKVQLKKSKNTIVKEVAIRDKKKVPLTPSK